jgi:gamma-tubulin complex component 3
MAAFNQERVEHALNELLARIVPDDPEEDEDQANERFDAAYNFALDELTQAGPLPVVADINHVAGLIDRRGRTHTVCRYTPFNSLTFI